MPLHDPSPDPGLFGPASVTWKVVREPTILLLGGRALLMQAAHPLVAQGAIDHSAYARDPYGRFQRTIEWVSVVTYGTTAEAKAACRHVNQLHHHVSGTLPRGSGNRRVHGGAHYTATDADLLRWVHATIVENLVVAHDTLVGTLTTDDRDTMTREWNAVGRMMGVPRALLFQSFAEVRAYVDGVIAAGVAAPGAGSRVVSRTILMPPLPLPLRPLFEAVSFLNTGSLPPTLRRGYGVRWTPAHSAAHRGACLWFRTATHLLPRRLRVTPIHMRATARVEGRWPGRMAA